MKAAVFHGPKLPLSIEDVELDKPQDREVLIKTVASGVCHSDLHFVDGFYPYPAPAVLGHEAAGIIEEVGKQVTYVKPGDHVICCLSVFCGNCEQCMSGHPNRCSNKQATQRAPKDKPRISQKGKLVNQFLDISSYCEKMLLHENAVVKIREDLPLDRAALIGCGVTTGVGAVLNTAKIEPGSTVAVFGAGGVGLAAIQGARIAGARKIIAVDMFEGKLAMAKRLGATDTIDASSSDPVDEIRKMTGGGVDYSFEAIGLKKAAEQAFNSLKAGGTATVIGMIPVGQKVEIDGYMFLTEREVVVRTVASGVCHSDLHFVDGLYMWPTPAILGHEAAGVVEKVGSQVSYLKPGDHVIACLSVFCGYCEECMSGHPNLCSNKAATQRTPTDKPRLSQKGKMVNQFADLSGYAEKMLLHENALVKIGDDVPLDRAALIGCGVMTGVGAALNTAKVAPGSTVAVFGAGGVGLSIIQGARIAGARMIIAVDKFPSKLELAKKLGATHAVDASKGDAVDQIRTLTNGGVEYSFEAIGLKVAAEQAYESIAPGGIATIVGMVPLGQKVDVDGFSLLFEKRIQGCFMGSNRFRIDMPRIIELYQQGRLDLDDMITRRGKLEDVNEAFRAMKAGEVARTVLMFD